MNRKKYLLMCVSTLWIANAAQAQNINCCTTDECRRYYLSGAAETKMDDTEKLTTRNGQNQSWVVTNDMLAKMTKMPAQNSLYNGLLATPDYLLKQNINETYANSCDEASLNSDGRFGNELVGKGTFEMNRKTYSNVSKTKKVSSIASSDENSIQYTVSYNWYLGNSVSPSFSISEVHIISSAGAHLITRQYYATRTLEGKGGIITVSPNPVKQLSTITLDLTEVQEGNLLLNVLDNLGIPKLTRNLSSGEKSINVDFSQWLTGFYQVQLIKDNQLIDVAQVIKE